MMTIGDSPARFEAIGKLTGQARYTADLQLPGMLHARLLRSPYPHARILRIDTSRAESLPGVHAVLTARDLPNRLTGLKRKDLPVLATDRVRFTGERIAAVAADDLETASQALELIEVEYEPLEAVFDPLQAIQPETAALHGDLDEHNVYAREVFGKGDVEQGFSQSDHIFEGTYSTQMVHQAYMEPRVCQVAVGVDGLVTVWSSNKGPFGLRKLLAEYLDLPEDRIRVISSHIGGDFGGKSMLSNEPICYFLSLKTGRPVRLAMTRQEEFQAGNPRHAAIIRLKTGVRKDGKIIAREAEVLFNGGAYAAFNVNVFPKGGSRGAGAYDIPNTRIEVCSVATNLMHCGHMRSPGNPQVYFAVESHMDEIASQLGIDPLEFRLLNAFQGDAESPLGKAWQDTRQKDTLLAARKSIAWPRSAEVSGSWRIGYGFACAERNIGVGRSQAEIRLHESGDFEVVSGAVDVGTGLPTVLRQIAAEELNVAPERVKITFADTNAAPYDQGAGSSRHTHTAGRALILAIEDLKEKASRLVEDLLECPPELVEYTDGRWQLRNQSDRAVSWADIAGYAHQQHVSLTGFGSYESKGASQTCFATHAAKVAVDTETGELRVLEVVAVHDVGKALFPTALLGQVEGSVLQGVGYATLEKIDYQNGQPLTVLFSDYGLPTTCEMPEVKAVFLEGGSSPGPYNAKSIGEIGIDPVAGAVANAVWHACGVRIRDLPITAEKILAGLKGSDTQPSEASAS